MRYKEYGALYGALTFTTIVIIFGFMIYASWWGSPNQELYRDCTPNKMTSIITVTNGYITSCTVAGNTITPH